MRHPKSTYVNLVRFVLLLVLLGLPADGWPQASPLPTHPDNPYSTERRYASLLVIDAVTEDVLLSDQPDLPRAPASLVKMMTLLLLLETIERGEISLESELEVSWRSSKIGGSGVGLVSHEKLTVEEAAQALIISSGNDAAIAIAGHLAGSESVFATRMNRRCRELGMTATSYFNAHGLDGWKPGSVTTAHDQAILARKLLEFPDVLRWTSNRSVTIRGGQTIRSTNKLLGRVEGVDGLKTGYIGKAGFCLVATAERAGHRIISVLLGGTNSQARFDESAWALTEAFLRFERVQPLSAGDDLGLVELPGSVPASLRLVAEEDVILCLPRPFDEDLTTTSRLIRGLAPPITVGTALTKIEIRSGNRVLARTQGIAAESARAETFFERLQRWFKR